MTLLVRTVIGLIAALVPVTMFAATCGCTEASVSERYESSQVVFLGEAIRTMKSDRGEAWTVLRFTPSEAWKGAGGKYMDVLVPTQNGSCSIEILIGQTYLIFATAEPSGTLVTTACSGTKRANAAADDLQFLRAQSHSLPLPKRFTDVPTDYPYEKAIMDLRLAGVIKGYPDESFRPERPVSRAELAKMLDGSVLPYDFIQRRIDEFPFTDRGLPFTDVADRAWYNLPIRRAYRADIIEGYRDGTFRPEQSVTVAEASKMVISALSLEAPGLGAVWYERFIHAVADRKAMPQSVRSIEEPITRGELAEIIWRLTQHIENRPFLTSDELLDRKCLTSDDSTVDRVDIRQVREAWLGWYNDERRKRGLHPYVYEPYLNRSAALWSRLSAEKNTMTHVRDGSSGTYNYADIKKWFMDLGLEFQNVGGITFTENIGRGPYTCSDTDCTQEFIDAIRYTFDYFLSEEGRAYRPHFNAIVSPSFHIIGLGVAMRGGDYYLTAHFGTDITSSPPRLCGVDG